MAKCRAMLGRTWRKRGHSSLRGAVTCIATKTDKGLAYEGLNKASNKYARFTSIDSEEYQLFKANHQCGANYGGSTAAMEQTGIKRMFKGYVQNFKLMYTEYLQKEIVLRLIMWQKINHMVGALLSIS